MCGSGNQRLTMTGDYRNYVLPNDEVPAACEIANIVFVLTTLFFKH